MTMWIKAFTKARSDRGFNGRWWQMHGSYHTWWLASATDGLYSAGGSLVARSVAGTAGTHVGWEVDAQATYFYSPQLQIAGGYAHLIPGEFLKGTTPGHAYSYPYVMVTYVFLGEQPARQHLQSP